VRLSRDKVNVLARAVADALKQMDEVDFIEDPTPSGRKPAKFWKTFSITKPASIKPPG